MTLCNQKQATINHVLNLHVVKQHEIKSCEK